MPLNPRNLTVEHHLRLRRALWVWCIAMVVVGLGWGVFFAIRGDWINTALDVLMVAGGALAGVMIRRNHIRASALLMITIVFAELCVIAIYMDIPNAQAPRVSHQYFLVLGIGALLVFRHEDSWLRWGVPSVNFFAYLVFASTTWGILTPLALGNDVRVMGSWVNTIIVMGIMLALLYAMQSDVSAHKVLAADLRKALLRKQFELYYQPQINENGAVAGAEALLRWNHPQEGWIAPGDFIPIAEQAGSMVPIGHWVLHAACAQLVAWSAQPHMAALTLSININAQQFNHADFIADVLSALKVSGADPNKLKIELTESMLVNDVDDIIRKMNQLQTHGIGFALDDFGTGYSSLAYLKRLPLHQIKIDQLFVRDVTTNSHDAAIARTLVSLGHDMRLTVIAEGVETEAQREFLLQLGCHVYQGYLFSRPIAAAAFDAFVRQRTAPV